MLSESEILHLLGESGAVPEGCRLGGLRVTDSYSCTYRITHVMVDLLCPDGTSRTWPLVVKCCDPGQQSGRREVDFYQTVAASMPPGTTLHCRHSAYDHSSRSFFLIFEDLKDTHAPAVADPLQPPSPESRADILECLSTIQLRWWNAPELHTPQYRSRYHDEEWLTSYFEERHSRVAGMLASPPEGLCEETVGDYFDILELLPGVLAARLASGRNLTLVHGDAHGGNFLLPRVADKRAVLLDWPNWRSGLPTEDLAYLIAAWPAAHQMEAVEVLLPRYFEQVNRQLPRSVRAYSEPAWRADLAIAAGWSLLYAVGLLGEVATEWAVQVAENAARLSRATGTLPLLRQSAAKLTL